MQTTITAVVGLAALGWAVYLLTGPVACWRMQSWSQRLPFLLWMAGLVYVAFLVAPSWLRTAALLSPAAAGVAEIVRQGRLRAGRDR